MAGIYRDSAGREVYGQNENNNTFPSVIGGKQETFDLITNGGAAVTTSPVTVYGGDYAWSITGTIGTNVQLQTLARDGSSWVNYLAARTTNDGGATPPGASLATLASNTQVRAVTTGTGSNLYVSLSRIPS